MQPMGNRSITFSNCRGSSKHLDIFKFNCVTPLETIALLTKSRISIREIHTGICSNEKYSYYIMVIPKDSIFNQNYLYSVEILTHRRCILEIVIVISVKFLTTVWHLITPNKKKKKSNAKHDKDNFSFDKIQQYRQQFSRWICCQRQINVNLSLATFKNTGMCQLLQQKPIIL